MATVLLCTNEPVLAEGLAKVFETSGEPADGPLQLVGWCSGTEQLRIEADKHQPDILLADLTSGVNIGILSGIPELHARTRIVLWVHEIPTELALQSMSLGIRGVLRKCLPVETLIRCLSRVYEGELWFEKALTDSLMTAQRFTLTRREGQLVALLSQGLKNKEIATALAISEGTVKVYLSRLFQKLGVKDRFELALFGLRNLSSGTEERQTPAGRNAAPGLQTPRSFFVDRAMNKSPLPGGNMVRTQSRY
jgi:DNA-binding NarL/FixJ family response regulator